MEAIYNWLNSLVNQNKSDFAKYPAINWLNPYSAYDYQEQRNSLLESNNTPTYFNGTKPYHKHISQGCSLCGAGEWSCLFITNKCNASCFYCPAPQNNDEQPSTQGIDFNSAMEYAHYVKFLGFKGVSFSGGEPLLFFNRTLEYLKAVRTVCGNNIYIWMYTNGILASEEKFKLLAQAGLNEIRFDIGATGFTLDKVKMAQGIIPIVSIEIPAIPEEKDQLIALLPQMSEAGVSNLNLHQLRLTHHNAKHLANRQYTIIPAERPLVLESELTALEIIKAANGQNLSIGVNYCSFHFKNRYQKAGFRRMLIKKIMPQATLTNNGYIREFTENSIEYKTIKFTNNPEHLFKPKTITIEGFTFYYTVLSVFSKEGLPKEKRQQISNLLNNEPNTIPEDNLLFKIWQHEYIEKGLREY
jgi:pyruvate formate-lyase activating enzyme-like uncharacterized protein